MNIETGRALLAERFRIVAPPEGVRAPAPNVSRGLGRDLLSAAWTSGPFEENFIPMIVFCSSLRPYR